MFCRDFENIAGDLAAERLMEAGARERALRHSAECALCAARLNAERALDAGLRALAESDGDKKAPAHVKLALRATFDQQVKVFAAPAPALAPARLRNRTLWSLAAAALILFAIAIALLSRNTAPNPNDMSNGGDRPPTPTPAPREHAPPSVIEPDRRERKAEKLFARSSKPAVKRRAPSRTTALNDVAGNNETVTDYIPLTYLADATALESGIVVRVELSQSAMIAMGLPVNIERTDSRVKADVVVGDDGVARAVRLVQ